MIDEPARDDSHNTWMPVGSADDYGSVFREIPLNHLLRLLCDSAFKYLPLAVLRFEKLCQFLSLGRRACRQQFDGESSTAESTSSVEPWGQLVPHVLGCYRSVGSRPNRR